LQLDLYTSENPERVRIAGDDIFLPADLATPFGLVFHELATNAVKHGSLSRQAGTVDLSWSLRPGTNGRLLTVTWRENGGPPAKPPQTAGFGTALIEKGIPNARVSREFGADGVVCTFELPLPDAHVQNHGAPGPNVP
jgi:two-component system CheB/CheR fusion protein